MVKRTGDMERRTWSSMEGTLNEFENQQMIEAFPNNFVVRMVVYAGMRTGEAQQLRSTWVNQTKRTASIRLGCLAVATDARPCAMDPGSEDS